MLDGVFAAAVTKSLKCCWSCVRYRGGQVNS